MKLLEKEEISSLPGEFRYSLDSGVEFAKELEENVIETRKTTSEIVVKIADELKEAIEGSRSVEEVDGPDLSLRARPSCPCQNLYLSLPQRILS